MLDGHVPIAESCHVLDARRLAVGFAERAGRHDRDSTFPHENFRDLHEAGLLALTVPTAEGGFESGLEEACAVLTEVGRGCASTALVLAMQFINMAQPRRGAGWSAPGWSAAVAETVLRSAVAEGALINVLRVEPALGTPARGGLPATLARRIGAGWSISGHKTTATGAPGLAWMLVFARTDEAEPRMGSFLIPAQAPGVRIEATWDQLGLRASGSHDVYFADVAVPADHAVDLRRPSDWAAADPFAAAWNTLSIASVYTGVALAARDWLIGFLRDRAPGNLGAPLATLPRMQEAVGEIDGLLFANRRLVASAAAAHDRGEALAPTEAGLIKTIAADHAIRAVQRALEVSGNPGLSRANPLERHLRDVLCARVHTPQIDAARLAAGRLALGV